MAGETLVYVWNFLFFFFLVVCMFARIYAHTRVGSEDTLGCGVGGHHRVLVLAFRLT